MMGMHRLTIYVSGRQVDANVLSKAIYYVDVVIPKMFTTLSLSKLPYLALPRLEGSFDEIINNLKELERLCRGRVSLIGVQYDMTHESIEFVKSLNVIIKETQMTMLNLRLRDDRNETIAGVVELLKELETSWMDYARVAISINDILTANLPLSTIERDSFAVSLSVLDSLKPVEDVRAELKSRVVELYSNARDKCTELSREMKLEFAGVDTSLISGSKLSLTQLVEILKGLPFYSVGTVSELVHLSDYLSSLKLEESINLGKFIVSYPNDLTLNNYASMETMTLKDFAYLAVSPVIGLDMLVVPSWTSDEVLMRFFKEVSMLSRLTKKGIFIRIVLADAEPGERVSIGEYDVTVIEPLL